MPLKDSAIAARIAGWWRKARSCAWKTIDPSPSTFRLKLGLRLKGMGKNPPVLEGLRPHSTDLLP